VKSPVAGGTPWALAGNGRVTAMGVYPVAYAAFDFSGRAVTTTTSATINTAIQIDVKAKRDDGTAALATAVAQLPSGFTARLAQCDGETLCLVRDVTTTPVFSGDLADTLLQAPAIGGIGVQDAVSAARYAMTVVSGAIHTPSLYLPADLPAATLPMLPLPDGVQPLTPLLQANFLESTLGWTNWAQSNRNMKLVLIRRIQIDGAGARTIVDTPVPPDGATQVKLAAMTDTAGASGTLILILGAEDTLGRRYFSKISLTR
jgi:hypothetical protein